jgi:hypothetical protein
MKKLIVIAVAFLLLLGATNLFAQTSGITGKGFKVGLNLAKYTGSDAKNMKMKVGFVGGGFITYSLTDLFAIQPELLFSMKGSKHDVTGGTAENKLTYIEIPVFFRVQLVGAPTFKPNFYAGPEIAFLLSAKASGPGYSDVDIKSDLKSTDFGIIGGVGADFPMGTGKLTVDIRYDAGLSKVFKTVSGFPEAKINNSAITFLVGYGF